MPIAEPRRPKDDRGRLHLVDALIFIAMIVVVVGSVELGAWQSQVGRRWMLGIMIVLPILIALRKRAHRLSGSRFVALAATFLSVLPGGCTAQVDGGPTSPVRELTPCTVTRIVDGDTFECSPLGRIRLIGVDTPERAQAPFGAAATQALADLLPNTGEIQLEADVEDLDQYDRALRYVWVDGRMVNWALVRTGYAVLLTYPPNVQYVDWFRSAQDAAREEAAGLWSMDGFDCSPQSYRRGDCR